MPRTILLDGDITAYVIATTSEVATHWGDDWWTLHADAAEAKDKLDAYISELMDELHGDVLIVSLSDSANFRKSVYADYKRNRAKTRKPMILPALRDHLRENYTVVERPGLEGDDVLGILATAPAALGKVGGRGETVIVSIDKDMKMIPGKLLNLNKAREAKFQGEIDEIDEAIVTITPTQADWWHLFQTLTGDATDGYPGCPGVGPKKASIALDPEIEGPYWPRIVRLYQSKQQTETDAIVQARCARILRATDYDFKRKEPILWSPK